MPGSRTWGVRERSIGLYNHLALAGGLGAAVGQCVAVGVRGADVTDHHPGGRVGSSNHRGPGHGCLIARVDHDRRDRHSDQHGR